MSIPRKSRTEQLATVVGVVMALPAILKAVYYWLSSLRNVWPLDFWKFLKTDIVALVECLDALLLALASYLVGSLLTTGWRTVGLRNGEGSGDRDLMERRLGSLKQTLLGTIVAIAAVQFIGLAIELRGQLEFADLATPTGALLVAVTILVLSKAHTSHASGGARSADSHGAGASGPAALAGGASVGGGVATSTTEAAGAGDRARN